MPSKTRKRGNSKRRMSKKNGPSNKTLARKIKHIENDLIELKFLDLYNSAVPIVAAGYSDYLSSIAQGDTSSTRTGNVVWPTSIQIKMNLTTSTAVLVPTVVRIILFWDQQSNGAAPVLSGAPTSNSLLDSGTITDTTISPRNYNTIKRYKILKDKTYTITPQVEGTVVAGVTTATLSLTKHIQLIKKLSRTVKYDDTSAVITSSVTNALHIAYFTNLAADTPVAKAGYRIYYKDA